MTVAMKRGASVNDSENDFVLVVHGCAVGGSFKVVQVSPPSGQEHRRNQLGNGQLVRARALDVFESTSSMTKTNRHDKAGNPDARWTTKQILHGSVLYERAVSGPAKLVSINGINNLKKVERVKRIELSYAAWEAAVLPLNYTRDRFAVAPSISGMVACLFERCDFQVDPVIGPGPAPDRIGCG